MFRFRMFAATAAAAVLLVGCGTDEAPVAEVAPAAHDLLAQVPAGTPYLSASLQAIPDEVIDRFLQRLEPVLTAAQGELSSARERIGADPEMNEPAGRLLLALMDEVDGKLNRAGLESLGFDLQAQRAFYGLGAFPVFRMGLADAGSLRATVRRVLERSGFSAPSLERDGRSYWRVPLGGPDSGDTSDSPAGLYIAILDDQLALGLFPSANEDESLAHLLGSSHPERSDAVDRLQAINARFGYSPYGTGEVNLVALADELMSADSTVGQAFMAAGIDVPSALGETCRAEIRSIVERMPHIYSGLSELTPDVVAYRVVMETEAGLAGEMAALVAPVPTVDPMSSRLLEFALGLKVGAVRDFLRTKATAIAQAPYRCEHLAGLNEGAQQAYEQLNQPIPPLVNNFEGIRASFSRFGGPEAPQDAEGVVAIHVEQPQMFVGMAQMFIPDLAELQLAPGSEPVRLPAGLLPMPEVVAFAALTDHAIGLSVGEGEQERLLPYLTAGIDAPGTFLSVNYDTAMYLEYSERFADAMSEFEAGTEGESPPHEGAQRIADAVREAYQAMAGRTDTRVAFTPEGIQVSSRMSFR